MKKVATLLICLFLIPVLAFSQMKGYRSLDDLLSTPAPNLKLAYPPAVIDDGKTADQPNLSYTTIASVISGQFSLFNMITPFVYDPISKALVLAVANYGASGNDLAGTITLYISTNYGQSWQTRGIYSKVGEVPVLASLGVMNPDKSTNPAQLSYFVYTPFARKDISNQYPWAGGLYTIATPGGTESIDFLYPGTLAGYSWWTSRVVAHSTSDGSFAYNVGMLRNSPTTQYGQYGFSAFSLNDYDYLFQGCPLSWSLSKFRTSDNLNSTYNSNMLIDVDNNGAVYAAVCNFFQPNVNNATDRVPGVSKSTDYGVTWSEFMPAPSSVFTDYASTWGGTVNPQYGVIVYPYDPNAFVVLGPDQYSFFTRAFIINDNKIVGLHIIEANYSGGLWTVTKVADFGGFPYIIEDVANEPNVLKDSLFKSFMGNELQAAKTADGNYIVLKWVDFIDKLIIVNPPLRISNGEQTLDTLLTTDVFFSYREKNQFMWSSPLNATNDTVYDKITWIPNIVPSLDKVPLVKERTRRIQYTDANNPRNSYPDFIQQLVVDYPQDVVFALVNLTGINEVQEPVNKSFYLKDPQPNPANGDYTEIGFVLDKPMEIRVELFDLMGNRIKTLYNGFASAGVHAVMLNTSELSSGAYYYKLSTSDGNSITKQLNVIR